jgi:hypothetical protein
MCLAMTQADLDKVRHALAGMKAVLARSYGGRADDDALLEFRRLCWSALLLADDPECHEQIDLLVQHAKDLYAGTEPARAEALRTSIGAVLEAFQARVAALEGGYGKRWRDLRAA